MAFSLNKMRQIRQVQKLFIYILWIYGKFENAKILCHLKSHLFHHFHKNTNLHRYSQSDNNLPI